MGAWDWTAEASEGLDDPSVDQLGGNVDSALWTDLDTANTGSGSALLDPVTLTTPASGGGKVLSVVLTGGGDITLGGIVMPSVAGNFIYAARIGSMFPAPPASGSPWAFPAEWEVQFCYWDGTNITASPDIAAGGTHGNGSLYDAVLGAAHKSGNANSFAQPSVTDAYIPSIGAAHTFDCWLERTGTTLTVWLALPGNPPIAFKSYTVTANAGLVGLRMTNKSEIDLQAFLYAFARVSAVPGR